VSSAIITSPEVSAEREDSELDFRLDPEESEDESWYDPDGEAVEGAESESCTLVSRNEWFGRGLLCAAAGDPKLRYWEPSVAKSSARNMPGLFAASIERLASRNSKAGSESNLPDMSESKMNGGELAEFCMTYTNMRSVVAQRTTSSQESSSDRNL
jgi:hypothetical protein